MWCCSLGDDAGSADDAEADAKMDQAKGREEKVLSRQGDFWISGFLDFFFFSHFSMTASSRYIMYAKCFLFAGSVIYQTFRERTKNITMFPKVTKVTNLTN